jgi:hypothetical protein
MAKFFVSRSAIQNAYVKKPKGFEAWFYTGATKHFGHSPRRGGKRK